MTVIEWLNSPAGLQWTRDNFHPVYHSPLVSIKDDAGPVEIECAILATRVQRFYTGMNVRTDDNAAC